MKHKVFLEGKAISMNRKVKMKDVLIYAIRKETVTFVILSLSLIGFCLNFSLFYYCVTGNLNLPSEVEWIVAIISFTVSVILIRNLSYDCPYLLRVSYDGAYRDFFLEDKIIPFDNRK